MKHRYLAEMSIKKGGSLPPNLLKILAPLMKKLRGGNKNKDLALRIAIDTQSDSGCGSGGSYSNSPAQNSTPRVS